MTHSLKCMNCEEGVFLHKYSMFHFERSITNLIIVLVTTDHTKDDFFSHGLLQSVGLTYSLDPHLLTASALLWTHQSLHLWKRAMCQKDNMLLHNKSQCA